MYAYKRHHCYNYGVGCKLTDGGKKPQYDCFHKSYGFLEIKETTSMWISRCVFENRMWKLESEHLLNDSMGMLQ